VERELQSALALIDFAGECRPLRGAKLLQHLLINSQLHTNVMAATSGQASEYELEDAGRLYNCRILPIEAVDACALLSITDETAAAFAHAQLLEATRTDSLTTLPNRLHLHEQLASILSVGEDAALLLLDLDGFKAVNDTLGHEFGDALLREIADKLRLSVRSHDIVARLGGDEFVIIIRNAITPSELASTATRLLSLLAESTTLNDEVIFSSASIGIAFVRSQHSAQELLREADLAMYAAKNSGGGTYRFFEAEMAVRARARTRLGQDLHHAFKHGEFSLSYQPQYDLRTNRIVSAECLLRLEDRTIPEDFVPLAERSGLIIPLGAWVLDRALRHASTWQRHGKVRVAVNVSPVQLRHPHFVEDVKTALKTHDLAAELLELEITESALAHEEHALRTLGALNDLGITLTIDDFGTGYSSLSRLQKFPLNALKIDRAFVQRLGESESADSIVRAVIALAHAFNLTVLAEGIENARQQEFLLREHCDLCSGWLFASAMSSDQFIDLIEERAQTRPR
jgi:diguanylate cyclase (GGDEF)-like protein